MTLAAFLCIGVLCFAMAAPLAASDTRESLGQDASSTSSEKTISPPQSIQNQQNGAGQDSSAQSNQATPPARPEKPLAQNAPGTTAPHRRRKKKSAQANCNPSPAAPATEASASGVPTNNPAPADRNAAGTGSTATNAPSDCPPQKVIVRQGGTSEPSIQLGGTAGSEPGSHERDTTNQMLTATQANLKKIEEQRLSADQQNVVTQIRQFMDQSKSADAAGDPERARTLAWKAQLLSEGLVKPQQ